MPSNGFVQQSQLKYRPEIDGLRTIAVLGVLFYHAEFFVNSRQVLTGGFLGVDVFFVISGFLITSLIITEYDKIGAFSLSNFYARRARRLLPALLTVILLSIPFAFEFLLPSQLKDYSASLIASLLFSSNFYWDATLQEYGAESGLLKPFLHTWSLAVEEQFYIIYPLLLVAVLRWWKKHTVVFFITASLLSLFFAAWLTPRNASLSFYMLPSRFWELLAGGLIAHFSYLRPHEANTLLYRTAPAIGLSLIITPFFLFEIDSNHPGFSTLIPVLGTMLVILFANEKDPVIKLLSTKFFVGIGLISYSLYLWHYPIFAFGRITDLTPSFQQKVIWILLAFSLSTITYIFIEKPVRARRVIPRMVAVGSLVLALGSIISFFVYVKLEDGLKNRFPALVKAYGKNEFDNVVLRRQSWSVLQSLAGIEGTSLFKILQVLPEREKTTVSFLQNAERLRILIVGNSHSKDLFNALYLNRRLFPDFEFARFGMMHHIPDSRLNELIESPNFKLADVVIVSFAYFPVTIKRLPLLIDAIKENGKPVFLTSNTIQFENIDGMPIFDWYIMKKRNGSTLTIPRLKEIFYEKRDKEIITKINPAIAQIAREHNVPYLDKSNFLCNEETRTCNGVTSNGFKSFFDHEHWTLEGSKYFGERIHEVDWLWPLYNSAPANIDVSRRNIGSK